MVNAGKQRGSAGQPKSALSVVVVEKDGAFGAAFPPDEPEKAYSTARKAGGFLWVNLVDPTMDDLRPFADALGLHPIAVSDAATGDQQPKVQDFGDQLFLVFWSLAEPGSQPDLDPIRLFIFVGDGFFVTVERDTASRSFDLRQELQDGREFLSEGSVGALYVMLSTIAKHYAATINAAEDELDALEREVFDQAVLDDSSRIYRLRKRIGRVERPLSSLVGSLQRNGSLTERYAARHPRLAPYLDDVIGDLISVGELAQHQGRSLDNVVSSHESNVSLRQNDDTRKISAIGALLAVPTVVAGLYGMNFDNLPGVGWEGGWAAVGAVIVVVDAGLFINFKRRGWL